MNNIETIYKESSCSATYFEKYSNYLKALLTSLDAKSVENVVNCFLDARKNDKTIYFAGNGGSAATASHFAQDLAEVGRKAKVKSFRTMGLTDNVSFITAVGNDYGYDKIFSVQMSELFNSGDVLVAISASGNSPNVVEAAKYARERGGTAIGLVGFDGGEVSKICDHVIHVKTLRGEYGPVEDVHMILDHMITSYLIGKLMESR
jgi:D-sedoheptulose 7-phosphate isomerase